MASPTKLRCSNFAALAPVGIAAGAWVWAYYSTLAGLVRLWGVESNYSHGFLIPLVAVNFAAFRFADLPALALPAPDSGLALLAAVRGGAGASDSITPLDYGWLPLTLAGLVLLADCWLGLAALTLLIVWAVGRSNFAAGLQDIATKASTFLLQLFGTTAYRGGNVIPTPARELGIAEARSGLKVLMVFCALAVVTAALVPLGRVRRVILAASARPPATACSVPRIPVAGTASNSLVSEARRFVFHVPAGPLMVPPALAMAGTETVILAELVRPGPPAGAS